MKRLSILLCCLVLGAVISMPSAAAAHAESSSAPSEPAPQISPTTDPADVIPAETDGSTTAVDALTIIGFSVLAMAGLLLIIRAGLRSASREDGD